MSETVEINSLPDSKFNSHILTDVVREIGELLIKELDLGIRDRPFHNFDHAVWVTKTSHQLACGDTTHMEQAQLMIASLGQFSRQNERGIDTEASADHTYQLMRGSMAFSFNECDVVREAIIIAAGRRGAETLGQDPANHQTVARYLTDADNAYLGLPTPEFWDKFNNHFVELFGQEASLLPTEFARFVGRYASILEKHRFEYPKTEELFPYVPKNALHTREVSQQLQAA